MSSEEEGPYRADARPPEPPLPWSTAAVASLPLAVSGWGAVWGFLAGDLVGLGPVAAVLLVASLLAGILGLSETNVVPATDDTSPPAARYRGRGLAKAGLGMLVAPLVLGCLLFGLLLLTCGGH